MRDFAIRHESGFIPHWPYPLISNYSEGSDPRPRQSNDISLDTRSQASSVRVRSLTVKRANSNDYDWNTGSCDEMESLLRRWRTYETEIPTLGAKLLNRYGQPFLIILSLLPCLTSLQIYHPSIQFDHHQFTECLAAWTPCLTVFHLYQDAVEPRLLIHLLFWCKELEEVEVSGLTLPDPALYGKGGDMDYDWEYSEIANQISRHTKLRHFASDRRNKKGVPYAPHGILLLYFGKIQNGPDVFRLRSLDIRDRDLQIELLVRYLSVSLSAEIQRLIVIVGRCEEKEEEARDQAEYEASKIEKSSKKFTSETLDLCTRQYDSPCFLQATTDLELACNKDFFPLAFFRRVGHRITSLRIYRSTRRHHEDTILTALQYGYFPRLGKVLVMGYDQAQKEKYVEELRAASMEQNIYFCTDSKDIEANDAYKRQPGWDGTAR